MENLQFIMFFFKFLYLILNKKKRVLPLNPLSVTIVSLFFSPMNKIVKQLQIKYLNNFLRILTRDCINDLSSIGIVSSHLG